MQKQQENIQKLRSSKDFLRILSHRKNLSKRKAILRKVELASGNNFVRLLVRFTQNNIFLNFVDKKSLKNTVSISGGALGFKGRSRQSSDSIHRVFDSLINIMLKTPTSFYGLEIRGQGRLRRFFLRRLSRLTKVRIHRALQSSSSPNNGFGKTTRFKLPVSSCLYVREIKTLPFNGCRQSRARRK